MKKVFKFVKTKRNRSSNSLEVVNTDSSTSCTTKTEQDDEDYDSQINKNQFENLISELSVSDQIEKSLKDDIISVLSASDKDLSTISSSPQSARIPPPLKPLRSLEFLHSETFNKNDLQNLKSNLVILGTVRTRHISFTEQTPQISADNTGENEPGENSKFLNDWSSEKSLPLSSTITTRPTPRLSHNVNRHFKRYSLDYNFKSKYPLKSEQPINEDFKPDLEQLETYDDALKHLDKCDLNQIHQKSRSLPRNTEAPLFNSYTELKQNSYSLPRSLTTTDSFQSTFKSDSFYEYPFLKKPFLKHFKNIFDYKKNFKRGRRLVKSFSFTRSTEDYSDEIKKFTNHSKGDDSLAQILDKRDTKDSKTSNQECTKTLSIQNLKAQSSEKTNSMSTPSDTGNNSTHSCSTTKELKNEVIQWKEQYDEVLKRIQNVDSSEINNLLYTNSTEFPNKEINKVQCKSCSSSTMRNIFCQTDIDEVVTILKKQYDKVEDILTKQNQKLEIMVQKLNSELSISKQKELDLEKKLSKLNPFDMIEITICGKKDQSTSVTLVAKQNQIISEAVQKLKEFLKEYQSDIDIFVVPVASGETLCEKLATLEIENCSLRKRMSKLERESIMSCDPTSENNLISNLTKSREEISALENKLKECEQIIDAQKKEIQELKQHEAELLKRLELEKEFESLKTFLTKQNSLVEKFTSEIDNLKIKLAAISGENILLTQKIATQEIIMQSNTNTISALENELKRKVSQIKILTNYQIDNPKSQSNIPKSQSLPKLPSDDHLHETQLTIKRSQSAFNIECECRQSSEVLFQTPESSYFEISPRKQPSLSTEFNKIQVNSSKYDDQNEQQIQIWDHLSDCSGKWQCNMEIIKHLCDELSDIKRYLNKSGSKQSKGTSDSPFHHLDDCQVKINQLQQKINEKNSRHHATCQTVKTPERNFDENNTKQLKNKESQFEEIERKLLEQFETTKKKLEEDLFQVQVKLDEKHKQQVALMKRCQEIMSNKSYTDSVLSNSELNSLKSFCDSQNCSMCGSRISPNNSQKSSNFIKTSHGDNPVLEYYRQQLNQTLEKARTSCLSDINTTAK